MDVLTSTFLANSTSSSYAPAKNPSPLCCNRNPRGKPSPRLRRRFSDCRVGYRLGISKIIYKRRFAPKESGVVVLYIYSLRTSTFFKNQCFFMDLSKRWTYVDYIYREAKESGVVFFYIYGLRTSTFFQNQCFFKDFSKRWTYVDHI